MSKTIKLISTLLIALIMVVATPNMAFADNTAETGKNVESGTADSILSNIDPSLGEAQTSGANVITLANKVIGFIQFIAILGGTIILAALGVKYMLGSVEEKAEYKKSFMPLIIGIIVVMGAVSIAKLLFNVFTGI